MILDYNLQFSDAQAETTAAAHASDYIIDTDVANANLGRANAAVVCKVNTAFTSDGSATLTVALEDCATEDGTYYALAQSKAWAVADLAKGTDLLTISLPREHKRYLRMNYTIGVAAMTAGAIDSFITIEPDTE